MRFFAILLSLDHTFFLKLYTVIAPNNVQHLVKENQQQMGRTGQTRAQKKFFRHFS